MCWLVVGPQQARQEESMGRNLGQRREGPRREATALS